MSRFILPILAEFSDSGYREPRDKVLDSLRSNAQYYAIVFGSGIIGLIYVLISYGAFSESLQSTVMALAYCWGLALAIYLMGHGLVAIPRRLFRNANISGKLRRIQSQAPRIYEKMEDADMNLEDLEMQVSELSKRRGGSVSLYQDWIEELLDLTNLPESGPATSRVVPGTGENNKILPTVITEKYMADLTRQLVRAKHSRARWVSEWNRLLRDAVRTQAILDSAASKKLDFGAASPAAGVLDKYNLLTPYTRFLLHYHALPKLHIALGGLLSLASVCIVWSEVVKGLLPNFSIIRYSVVHHWQGENGQVGFAGQVIAAFWMMYMCAAALTSITEVKVWRGRALVRRNTAHESAFWYASQVARLSVPLSYNFMTFLGALYRDTVFYDFLGQLINLTGLGTRFDMLFPAIILVPVGATLFGLYGRFRRSVGLGVDLIDDDDEEVDIYGSGTWREGRDLIERELNGTSAAIRSRRSEAATRIAGGGAGGARAAPIRSIPSSSSRRGARATGGPTTPLGTSPNTRPSVAGNPSARRSRQAEPEDENFFEALGHRIQNTFDTMDAPRWFQDIKKPKWMGGDEEGGGAGPSSRGGNGADVRRWFGGAGGSGEGRIRL